MSILYQKFQNKSQKSPAYLKWYGRAFHLHTVGTSTLAKNISHATTVTYADVLAVLQGLSVEMKQQLLASNRVKLDGLGTFKVGMRTKPADTKEDFTAVNIRSYHIVYQPEKHFVRSNSAEKNGFYMTDFLDGAVAKHLDLTKQPLSGADGTAQPADDAATAGGTAQPGADTGTAQPVTP